MKHILSTVFLVFISFASAQTKFEENPKKIIGEWTYLYRESRSWINGQIDIQKISFDEIVIVTFNSDNTITLKHSNNEEEKFSWKIKGNKIKVNHNGNGGSKKFLEGKFLIVLTENGLSLELRHDGPPHSNVYLRKS